MIAKERYDRSDIRRMNAVSVLGQLRQNGPLSRANIASRLGLTRATVSSIVAVLLDAGLVSETEYTMGNAGRPGLLLNLNPNVGSMIAIEIDLDRVSLIMTNLVRDVLWSENIKLDSNSSSEQVLQNCAEMVEAALKVSREKGLNCLGLGVAWAGLVQRDDGELAYGPTSGWEDIAIKEEWEKCFKIPVYIENEAHAGAIGAYHFGEKQGVGNFLYLSLGTGMAAGFFVDGVLLRGRNGFAGQVGHTFFTDNKIQCACGKQGCWVTEVGAQAIQRKLNEAGVELPQSDVLNADWINVVTQMAKSGDQRVIKVLEQVGEQVGRGSAALVQTFNPEVVVIGGRLAELMGLVEPVLTESLKASSLSHMADDIEVIIGEQGVEADPQVGCLATVFDAIMQNPIPSS